MEQEPERKTKRKVTLVSASFVWPWRREPGEKLVEFTNHLDSVRREEDESDESYKLRMDARAAYRDLLTIWRTPSGRAVMLFLICLVLLAVLTSCVLLARLLV